MWTPAARRVGRRLPGLSAAVRFPSAHGKGHRLGQKRWFQRGRRADLDPADQHPVLPHTQPLRRHRGLIRPQECDGGWKVDVDAPEDFDRVAELGLLSANRGASSEDGNDGTLARSPYLLRPDVVGDPASRQLASIFRWTE